MLYNLQDKDIVRILIIPKKDGTFVDKLSYRSVYINGKSIYDDSGLLNKIYKKIILTKKNPKKFGQFGLHHFYCIIKNNQLSYIRVGRTIDEIIQNFNLSDFRNEYYLYLNKKNIGPYDTFEDSYILIEQSNLSSDEDFYDFIRNKNSVSIYLEDMVNKSNVYNNIDLIKEEFGDLYLEIIQEEREKKLDSLLF